MNIVGWRPLTLLNVVLKMVTKMIANRLWGVLDHIIGPQQTAYLPGQFHRHEYKKVNRYAILCRKREY